VKHREFINSTLLDDNVGKIELWGDVMESKPCDWWTGEPLDIQCITPQDFKEAMAGLENCSTIELHLNSYGGDATVGIAIGNLLKQSGKHTVCVVEGIAASAAFTIAMSCDEVRVYPSSILMCHEVKSFMYGFYGNEDLKKIENGNTAYNNASAEVYSRKSGMSKAQCLNLMRKETWMTGADAINYNFADKLIAAESGSEEPVQLLNKTTMKINGVETDVSRLNIPDEFVEHTKNRKNLGGICMAKKDNDLKTKLLGAFSNAFDSIFKNEAEDDEEEKKKEEKVSETDEEKEKDTQPNTNKDKEKEEKAIQEMVNSAVEAERKRIQEIQSISATIDPNMVQEALFGETACDAKELALRAMKAEQGKAQEALNKMKKDNEASKANDVENKPGANIQVDEKTEREQAVKELQAKINGGK
jgi:ATP-dependent protease ClpP protease subunit